MKTGGFWLHKMHYRCRTAAGVSLRLVLFLLNCIAIGNMGLAEETALQATTKIRPNSDQTTKSSTPKNYWPAYRGPNDSAASDAVNLPENWSETSNVRWKTDIAGRGWSSPIVWNDTIWLTTATPDGLEQSIVGVDFDSGEIVCSIVALKNDSVQKDFDKSNSYASPTPTTDGERLYAHFGAYGTVCYDIKDRAHPVLLWQRRDLPCNHFRGAGSSPILFEDSLIFQMDGFDFHYAIALNKFTGDTLWKADRIIDYGTDDGDVMKAFATPRVIYSENRTQLISPTAKAVLSLNPKDGTEYWRVRYQEHSSATRPVFDGQMIYLNSGFSKAKLLAIKPDGAGDVTNTHVAWELNRGIGSKPSPSLYRDWLFSIEDRGVVTCVSKDDGKIAWQKRVGGDFSASPLVADGHLFCFDEKGTAYVFDASGTETLLATNQLDDGCKATPIAVNQQLIVRTKSSLYCIENK